MWAAERIRRGGWKKIVTAVPSVDGLELLFKLVTDEFRTEISLRDSPNFLLCQTTSVAEIWPPRNVIGG
jgi:hypothetical protein